MSKNAQNTIAEDLLAVHLAERNILFQRQYRYAVGRKLQADFAVVKAQLLIEVNGGLWINGAHGNPKGIIRDIDRLNQATLNRWFMLRFTPEQVYTGEAITFIQKVISSV